jgi:GNAT superfamily N-acetyltransferase
MPNLTDVAASCRLEMIVVSPDDVELVSFAPCDQSAVETFFQTAWRESRFPFDPGGSHRDLRQIATIYQLDGGGFWLLRQGEHIVGTIALGRLPGNTAEVKRLNVLPEYRGRGLGDQLLRHAIGESIAAGFVSLQLDTIRVLGSAAPLREAALWRFLATTTTPTPTCSSNWISAPAIQRHRPVATPGHHRQRVRRRSAASETRRL